MVQALGLLIPGPPPSKPPFDFATAVGVGGGVWEVMK